MYAIFRCPRCGNLQGMELRYSSVTCTSCSKRSKTDGSVVGGPFKNPDDMRSSLRDLKASKMEETEINLKDELIVKMDERSKKIRLNKGDEEDLLLSLISEGRDSLESLTRSLEDRDLGPDCIEEILERLQKKNMIYSPRYNVYRRV